LKYIGLAQPTALLYHYNNYDNFPPSVPGYVLWLAGELAWWWIITLLLAVLGAFVVRTELGSLPGQLLSLRGTPKRDAAEWSDFSPYADKRNRVRAGE
jgi:hypothetical protein